MVASFGTSGKAAPIWVNAFDDTASLPSGLIDHTISASVLGLQIDKIRVFRAGTGTSTDLDLFLGAGSTLQDHLNQSWTATGFESDRYKRLSVDTGSQLTSVFIEDDHDTFPLTGCSGGTRQIDCAGTPHGLFSFGQTTGSDFVDYSSTEYGFYDPQSDAYIYRLDVLLVQAPEPATLSLFGLGLLGLGLARRRNRTA
ncbi:MAG: PEP-CTERM sorting domain-containing protein [Alphaproteobacteria bacterium]|jgi:hypothetical protein|nr:PEP-CTERM sorting domain-containing protein [Alphaproteobacteria bacterium]MDP6812567.1 PEP-CTERM sorting domain-containing protein [Alphaproteobacteria bacterium]